MSASGNAARKLAIAIAATASALLAVEVGLGLFRPVDFMRPAPRQSGARDLWNGTIHRPSERPGLRYELAPDLAQPSLGMHVATNSLGMRDREPLPSSTPGLVRILAVGDSVTFGYGVEEPAVFASVLEELLAASPLADGRVFDVLNVGVSGYSTRDELAAFEGKWLALEPDVVVIGYCINDPEIAPRQPLQRVFAATSLWQRSHLLRWVAQKWQARQIHELGRGNYARYLHAPDEAPWRSVASAFARFGELSRDLGFPIVLVIFPRFTPAEWKDYPIHDVHAQVAREGERHGFLVLDLLPRYERESPASLLIDPSDSHPNALGHRIAAEEIARFLEGQPALRAALR